MMAPPPDAFMSGSTAWAAKNWWRRFTAMRLSQYSGVTSSVRWRSSCTALFTSTVIGPIASRSPAMAARSCAMSVRSAWA